MTRFVMATTAAVLLGCGSAFAQVGGMSISPGAPLGMTSPLGIGPGSPVAPTRVPLGATELASPGVSPMTSGASPMGPTTGSTTCSGVGGYMPQPAFGMGGGSMSATSPDAGTSGSTSLFDEAGVSVAVLGPCASVRCTLLAGPV